MSKTGNISVSFTNFALALVLPMFWLGGCVSLQSKANLRQYLDEATGTTVTGLQEPIIFSHAEPSVAANARDYIYVGPLETNRMGQRAYYLWFGEWSSVDRIRSPKSEDNGLEDIIVLLDGVPMDLHDSLVSSAKTRIIEAPYSAPVSSARSVYMRVSRDQLGAIAKADKVVIRVGGASRIITYDLWSGNIASFGAITNSTAADSRRLADISD